MSKIAKRMLIAFTALVLVVFALSSFSDNSERTADSFWCVRSAPNALACLGLLAGLDRIVWVVMTGPQTPGRSPGEDHPSPRGGNAQRLPRHDDEQPKREAA